MVTLQWRTNDEKTAIRLVDRIIETGRLELEGSPKEMPWCSGASPQNTLIHRINGGEYRRGAFDAMWILPLGKYRLPGSTETENCNRSDKAEREICSA